MIQTKEEDFFKYIFAPQTLPKEIFDYITQNQNRFESEIKFCQELLTISKESAEPILPFALAKNNVVELFPRVASATQPHGVRLAAASLQEKTVNTHLSFSDSDMNFLIRISKVNDRPMMYLFTKEKCEERFKIIIHPSNNEYLIEDISKPVCIKEDVEPEKISLMKTSV